MRYGAPHPALTRPIAANRRRQTLILPVTAVSATLFPGVTGGPCRWPAACRRRFGHLGEPQFARYDLPRNRGRPLKSRPGGNGHEDIRKFPKPFALLRSRAVAGRLGKRRRGPGDDLGRTDGRL